VILRKNFGISWELMSEHSPWSEIKHKRAAPGVESWTLVMHRRYRPWWGLGLAVRSKMFTATRRLAEHEALAVLATMQAEYPDWQMELGPGEACE